VLVRPELNSRPPARQPDAQPTEPPVAVERAHVAIGSRRHSIATTHMAKLQALSVNISISHASYLV